MINAINSTTANCSPLKQSFGQKAPAGQVDYRPEELDKKQFKKARNKAIAKHFATQVVAGAVFSGIWDGAVNLYRAVSKNGKELMKLPEIGKRAALMGGVFALISAVFMGINAAMYSKKQK